MQSNKKVTIVGGGITGLTIALLLSQADSNLEIVIFEAKGDPRIANRINDLSPSHGGDPLSNCVRHITTTESIVAPADVTELVAEASNPAILKILNDLGFDKWNQSSKLHADHIFFNPESNVETNEIHAQINAAGLELWLACRNPIFANSILSRGTIDVVHGDEEQFQEDLVLENSVIWQGKDIQQISVIPTPYRDFLTPSAEQCLSLPGMAIDSREFTKALLDELDKRTNVRIKFNTTCSRVSDNQGMVIQAGNSLHKPTGTGNYVSRNSGHQRLTGLAGFWVNVENTMGITKPFKFALPLPLGYLNITPNANGRLSISGGLLKVPYYGAIAQALVDQYKSVFLSELKKHITLEEVQKLTVDDVSGCMRPYSDNGLAVYKFGDNEIDISGASKAGATQVWANGAAVLKHMEYDLEKVFGQVLGDIDGLVLYPGALNAISQYGNNLSLRV